MSDKYITPDELKQISKLCDTLNRASSDLHFAGNVYDSNGEVLGTVEYTDNAEYGFVVNKEYVEK